MKIPQVNWRPVICGALFQFLLGVFCIRMEIGRKIFGCIGNKVSTFLNYTVSGSSFVFGHFLVVEKGVFAFAVSLKLKLKFLALYIECFFGVLGAANYILLQFHHFGALLLECDAMDCAKIGLDSAIDPWYDRL